MTIWEKLAAILAVVVGPCLVAILLLVPELHQLDRLITICLFGLVINAGLLVIVLRDIFLRRFNQPNMRFIWIGLVLFIWPSIVFYLFLHGFRPRN